MGGLEEQGVEVELSGRVGGKQEFGSREGRVGRRREEGAERGSKLHCNYNSFTITIRYHRLPELSSVWSPELGRSRVWELRARELRVWEPKAREVQS